MCTVLANAEFVEVDRDEVDRLRKRFMKLDKVGSYSNETLLAKGLSKCVDIG